jgi:hypothetical protein
MNNLKVGLQNYQWSVHVFSWLNYTECTILNAVDPAQQLFIRIPGTKKDLCTPNNIKIWIDYALRQGWYQQSMIFEIKNSKIFSPVRSLTHSLAAESSLCLLLAKREVNKISSLDKSNLCYQLEALEAYLSFPLPSLFKLLYLHLGNGDFGPDYGFFQLHGSNKLSKRTVKQAYRQIHQAAIKDWDWCLDKQMLPVLYWGADIYTLVDCSPLQKGVFVLDMNLKKSDTLWKDCFWKHGESFYEWCLKWQKGDLTGRSLWLEMYQLKGLI